MRSFSTSSSSSTSSSRTHQYSFPLYLFPSNPFRFRRRSSTNSNSTSATVPSLSNSPSSSPASSPPKFPTNYLSAQTTSHLRCNKCLTDLVPTSSIISKGFTGRHGRAYLVAPPSSSKSVLDSTHQTKFTFSNPRAPGSKSGDLAAGDLLNIITHKPAPRQLVTGAHTVADIGCRVCGTLLGWKYVDAEEDGQKYKVGMYILETKKVARTSGWEEYFDGEEELGGITEEKRMSKSKGEKERGVGDVKVKDEDIEFDSQDEDECEDLFAGVWSPALARRRRANKVGR